MESTGLKGMFFLWTLANPYSRPKLSSNGPESFTKLLKSSSDQNLLTQLKIRRLNVIALAFSDLIFVGIIGETIILLYGHKLRSLTSVDNQESNAARMLTCPLRPVLLWYRSLRLFIPKWNIIFWYPLSYMTIKNTFQNSMIYSFGYPLCELSQRTI